MPEAGRGGGEGECPSEAYPSDKCFNGVALGLHWCCTAKDYSIEIVVDIAERMWYSGIMDQRAHTLRLRDSQLTGD